MEARRPLGHEVKHTCSNADSTWPSLALSAVFQKLPDVTRLNTGE